MGKPAFLDRECSILEVRNDKESPVVVLLP